MEKAEQQMATLELMADQEDQLSALYGVFAEKFSGHHEFWSIISREEISHGNWIRILTEKVKNQSVFYNKDRFKSSVLEKTIIYIQDKIKEAQAENFSLINAVCLAYGIEQSLLENKYFEVFESDNVEVKNTLNKLRVSTEVHLERVQEFWQELRLEFGIEHETIEEYLSHEMDSKK